jgi:CRP-like cAMP-binding protein
MTPNAHGTASPHPPGAAATKAGPPALETLVSSHPFLQGLTVRQLSILSAHAMHSHFAAGQLIFREGDLANRFYLILAGQVALEAYTKPHGKILIQTIGPGDVLGWSWLFPPFTWHFDARALEPTEAIFFYGTRLREQCEEDRDLGYELIRRAAQVMIDRLQATRKKLLLAHAGAG